jgi:hypothetical protein
MTPIDKELARLAGLSGRDLRAEWRRRFRREPPPDLSRDLLLRSITYKAQDHRRRHPGQSQRRPGYRARRPSGARLGRSGAFRARA